ncbi:MAG: hypothetical protein WA966_13535 [Ornithinimicrobium sp.]
MSDTGTQRRQLANLGPMQQLRAGRLARRLMQLAVGLFLYGASMALVIRASLGLIPWDVLSVGLIQHVPMSFGSMTILVSIVVLLIWIPLRQRPGLGTIANAFLVGLSADLTLALTPDLDSLTVRLPLLLGAIALNGLATALYVGAQLGPGPRDGLMTGLARVSGLSIRVVRTALEVSVVLVGFTLGGTAGLGTVLYALAIGPLTQAMLPRFTVELREYSGTSGR